MNSPESLTPIERLLEALARECQGAQAGSDQGQFPILDLLGNLRDAAGSTPGAEQLRATCAQAWERVAIIVESGRGFQAEEVEWLKELLKELQAAANAPVPPTPVAAMPVAPVTPEPDEEAPLNLNLAEDGELLREFINESREHLDNIEQGVLVLEQHPADAETLNTVFRAFHTFKGGAGFLNLLPVNRLAHSLESLLDLARQGKLVISRPVIELILRGWDTLKSFIDEIEGQLAGSRPVAPIQIPTVKLKRDVLALMESVATNGAVQPSAAAAAPEPSANLVAAPLPVAEPTAVPSPKAEPAAPAEPLGAGQPTPSEPSPQSHRAEQAAAVKVDTAKLDALLDLVGEMVIAQSLVTQDLNQLAELNPRFARNMAQLSQISRDLQRVSMSLRMLPIRGAFQKMARVVRDLSTKQHKQVQLLTSGEDTELDRGVVEELNDPLLHMIRNSIDHGIEPAEVRVANGKPALATVHLRAFHQGGNIVLEIADDGAGLNKDRILAKAIERGLTTPDAKHTEEEIFKFIFAPGFSTAAKVTDISGRGVGLDVVRRNLERLRGCVDVSSTLGQGTLFKITLPLTLAIIDGLVVQVGQERYILPTLAVRESFRPHAEMFSTVQGRGEVVNVRGRLLPLLRLYECFGLTPGSTDPTKGIIVVVQAGTDYRCLLVDGLLHKQEVVIKSLNELMAHQNRFLAGAAILGDGRVALILDVNALVHLEAQPFAQVA
jgi:two-component system, chemotaxis family, sensor kinase CheA